MINKFRRKCILIAMISVTLVLTLIAGTINIVNHIRMTNNADRLITMIIDNGGTLDNNQGRAVPTDEEFNDETPFQTRYFTVVKDSEGVYTYYLDHIVSVKQSDAEAILNEANGKNSSKGYINEYRYGKVSYDDVTLYVFVNCSKEFESVRYFTYISTVVSIIGLMFVFILAYIFTGLIIKPLMESYDKQKSFITNASHEMKTPLTIISANNEIIELEYGKSESTEAISKQVRRLNTMVKDMTTLAKLDERDKLGKSKVANISELLEGICDDFKPAFQNDGIELLINIEDNINYSCDISLIRKLFLMLVDNAYKYSKTYTNVSLLTDAKEIYLEVSNDAENIKVGSLNNLFERFKRSEEARAAGIEGSGIGLSVAYEIVKLHKGEIIAEGYENNVFAIKVILKQ